MNVYTLVDDHVRLIMKKGMEHIFEKSGRCEIVMTMDELKPGQSAYIKMRASKNYS